MRWQSSCLSALILTMASALKMSSSALSKSQVMRVVSEHASAKDLSKRVSDRESGRGDPHRSSTLRLFDEKDTYEPRVTFYRDSAAWCPYCQKTWMLLEEKRIPYRVELINMRSYGDKPTSFTNRVRGGLLPAVELDGQMYTESLDIMVMLAREFADSGKNLLFDLERTNELLRFERQLFSSWCGFLFRGGMGTQFKKDLKTVEGVIQGPFFLGDLSLVDLQYASHLERMCASAAYWKGYDIRAQHPKIDQWFRALEELPSFQASRSDYYTHVMNIPPQYGQPSFSDQKFKKSIGDPESWRYPLDEEDPLQPNWHSVAPPKFEAAFQLVQNLEAVAGFASRPVASKAVVGKWARNRPDRAQLADPYSPPADEKDDVEMALLWASGVLLDQVEIDDCEFSREWSKERKLRLAECCRYLRDRVGVPRDMTYPAARHLRATLNALIDKLVS